MMNKYKAQKDIALTIAKHNAAQVEDLKGQFRLAVQAFQAIERSASHDEARMIASIALNRLDVPHEGVQVYREPS